MGVSMQPNDLPIVCLPLDLSDEAAAGLIEFLQELTAALERHYYAQLRRHYHLPGTEDSQDTGCGGLDLDRDPPF
jgi:hypothetical protein